MIKKIMYILDWITCCCYMMLRKIHYTKTGAETSAVANTCVIAGLWFITITNMFLWIISPTTLQWIYHKSNVYSITMMAIALAFIYLRYYYLRKNAISLMAKHFNEKGPHNGLILFFVNFSILIGSITGCIIMGLYIKSQGIVFGGW